MTLAALDAILVSLHWVATIAMLAVIAAYAVGYRRHKWVSIGLALCWAVALYTVVWHSIPAFPTQGGQVGLYAFFTVMSFAVLRSAVRPWVADRNFQTNRKLLGRLFGQESLKQLDAAYERRQANRSGPPRR